MADHARRAAREGRLLRRDLLLARGDRVGLGGEEDRVGVRLGRRGDGGLGDGDKEPPLCGGLGASSVSCVEGSHDKRAIDARFVFSSVVFCAPLPDAQTYMTASEFCVLPETHADERHLFLLPNWRRCQGTLELE